MTEAGYIKLYRSLKEHWLWQIKRKFSKFEAWVDILFRCNHKCKKLAEGYGVTWVLRGQFISSNYELAKGWGWSEASVRKFIKQLEKDGMLFVQSRNKNSTYEVINYCVYQSLDLSELQLYGIRTENAQRTHKRRTEYAQSTPNNNDNNDNNIYTTTTPLYPPVKSPEKVYQENIGLLTPIIAEQIKSFLDDGLSEGLIVKAIEAAVANNKRSWRYISTVLQNCMNDNVFTAEQYEAKEKEREANGGGQSGRDRKNNKGDGGEPISGIGIKI